MIDMEVRAASVQVAIQFAERWNLAGIVFACEPLLLCPRLVGVVKGRGLVCATYGGLNNEPEKVKVGLLVDGPAWLIFRGLSTGLTKVI